MILCVETYRYYLFYARNRTFMKKKKNYYKTNETFKIFAKNVFCVLKYTSGFLRVIDLHVCMNVSICI